MTRFKDLKQHGNLSVEARKFEAEVDAKYIELQLLSPPELEKLIINTRKFNDDNKVLVLEGVYARKIRIL